MRPAGLLVASTLVAVAASAMPLGVVWAQPPNVGDAKTAAREYHDSGAYDADLRAVNADATAWVRQRVPQVPHAAVVFDIDETVLSNWEVIVADDFGRVIDGPCVLPDFCAWRPWDLLARAVAIDATRETYRAAADAGAALYFVTGRDEGQRAATERNLADAGFVGYRELVMAPVGVAFASAADFKAPRRAAIEAAGQRIVANIGDQPSDLVGGHAERTFLLPDPFYRIP